MRSNPEDPASFFCCSPEGPVVMHCPAGLVYDAGSSRCEWPEDLHSAEQETESGDETQDTYEGIRTEEQIQVDTEEESDVLNYDFTEETWTPTSNTEETSETDGASLDTEPAKAEDTETSTDTTEIWTADTEPTMENTETTTENTDTTTWVTVVTTENTEKTTEETEATTENTETTTESIEITTSAPIEETDEPTTTTKSPVVKCNPGRMFMADPQSCNHFYQCAHGVPYRFACPARLVFNPRINVCDWPFNYKCRT